MLNRVELIGHLDGEPEFRETDAGFETTFRLLTEPALRPGRPHPLPPALESHRIEAVGAIAEEMVQSLGDGHLVYLQGQLRTRVLPIEGAVCPVTSVVVHDWRHLAVALRAREAA